MKRLLMMVLSVVLSGGLWNEAIAAVPHLIRYQGMLVDTQQVPLEGPYTLTFRLYDAATAGTKVWEETQTNAPVVHGQFSVLLGQVTPLDLVFDKDLWLSIQVNTDAEMSPRQQLSSVPYAYRADVATTAQTAQNMKTSAIEDDGKHFIPVGGIILWMGASCPDGYLRAASLDGAMLKAGASYEAPRPSGVADLPAHSHTGPRHTHVMDPHKHNILTDEDNWVDGRSGGGVFWGSNAIQSTVATMQPAGDGPTSTVGSGTVTTVVLCQKQ